MKAIKTQYNAGYGEMQDCIKVISDNDPETYVRFAPLYSLIGSTKVIMTEYVNGEFNSSDTLGVDWEDLTLEDAERIVKKESVYL